MREFGIPGFELMKRAGEGAFRECRKIWPKINRICVLCGSGNNGGDGFVFASASLKSGISTRVYYSTHPKSEESRQAFKEFSELKGRCTPLESFVGCRENELIVDALLGSGLSREVDGEYKRVIELVNQHVNPVVSLDMPSGLDGDAGQVLGCAVEAKLTVTFISFKSGLLMGQGRHHSGKLVLDHLNVPEQAYQRVNCVANRIVARELAQIVRKRKSDVHKYKVGRVLIVGGSSTMEGAAMMAAKSAYRVGAGLVAVAIPTNDVAKFVSWLPEARIFDGSELKAVEDLVDQCDVVAVGPGLGQDAWAYRIFEMIAKRSPKVVVDADALNILAKTQFKRSDWVLTPHPGEAGRLLGCTSEKIQSDRFEAVKQIASRYGGVCVLKGAGSLVSDGKDTWLCDRGNPGMATGGMGDILTGVVSSLWAQGMKSVDAARTAVWLHATAGDDCAGEAGEIGMVATDLISPMRVRLNELINGAHGE